MAAYNRQPRAQPWDLAPPPPAPVTVAAESLLLNVDKIQENNPESIIGEDGRTEVNPKDFAPGGKYRSIVKLQMKYEGQAPSDQRWAMGTGWLVAPDVLVTAGHCVHMWQNAWGHASKINAYIGYSGRASIGTSNVQTRRGVRAVTTEGWLTSNENRKNDVGFVKLDRPFDNVVPFEIGTTPTQGEEKLCVVGYPGDMYDRTTKEKGYYMFEEFVPTKFNLTTDKPADMLSYKISTFNGQSGSPVLIEKNGKVLNVAIGVHVYGGSGDNAASPINGQYGNPFDVYLSALGFNPQTPENNRNASSKTYASIAGGSKFNSEYNSTGFSNSVIARKPSPYHTLSTGFVGIPATAGEEGFIDTFRSIARIGGPIVKTLINVGTPFLGPAGIAVSALANVALARAGNIASGGTESAFDSSDNEGLVERAVLGEAALHTVLAMPVEKVQRLGIMSAIKQNYDTLPKASDDVAPKILAPVLESALRITHQHQLEPTQSVAGPSKQGAVTAAEEAFCEYLGKPSTARPTGLGSEEGFMDVVGSVGDFIKKGLAFGKPIAISMIKQGLNKLASQIPESSIDDNNSEHLNHLAKRAVMGEAALRALTSLPPQELKEEGFFDTIFNTIKSVAGTVIDHAPTIINGVTKVVGALTQESAISGPMPGRYQTGGLAPSQPPGLHRQKSRSLFDTLALEGPTGVAQSTQDCIPLYYVTADDARRPNLAPVPQPADRIERPPGLLRQDSNRDLPMMGPPPPQL